MFILPHETVVSEAQGLPLDIINPLRPHICGGHAELRRYSVASEKSLGLLGAYSPDVASNYNWPNKTVGTKVDLDFVKVYIDDAHLKYYENAVGVGDTLASVAGYSNRVKITSSGESSKGFKANGSTYPRFTALKERDVAINDIVWVRGTNGGNTKELWTYVKDFVANVIAAVIGTASADSGNVATQIAAKTPTQTSGALNYVRTQASDVDVTNYDGLPSGYINETYTIVVTQGSTGGDATTAKFKVTSASGLDDVAEVTPAAFAAATTIGTRGLTVLFSIDNTRPVDAGQPTSDFVVGQTWRIVIGQAWTGTIPTVAGTYTGDVDASYKIEVTRGGKFQTNVSLPAPNPNPQPTTNAAGGTVADGTYYIKVTYTGSVSGETDQPNAAKSITTAGGGTSIIDIPAPTTVTGAANWKIYVGTSSSGPFYIQGALRTLGSPVTLTALTLSGTQIPTTNNALYLGNNPSPPQVTVTAPGVDSGVSSVTAANSAVAIGALGLTFKTQAGVSGLRKGDLFYADVTGPKDGAYQTLVLGHNLDADLKAATDLDIKLYIKKNIQIAKSRTESPPDVNWAADQTYVTLKSGITAYDTSWTEGGVQLPLPVTKGTAYVEYRSWLKTFAASLSEITSGDPETLKSVFGPLHPDNPLGWGVYRAAQLSRGLAVKFTAMADPDDLDEWTSVLAMLEGQESIYHLTPMTFDEAVHDLYIAHVQDQSVDSKGMWRVCWLPLLAESSTVLVDSTKTVETDGTKQAKTAMATLKDDPEATGTQYTLLECTTANGKFVTNGVAAGDIVRFLYSVDGFGAETYTEFVIGSVINEDTVLLESGHSVAISTAQRFEIWRTLTKDAVADTLVARATAVKDQRVRFVWPDSIDGGGVTQDGYYAACAAAGLAGSIAPHQGMGFVELAGFDAVPRSTSYFNNGQLTKLKNGGIFVISQAPSGEIYVHSARTSDTTTVNTREEMVVRATDAIRLHLRSRVSRYFGNGNLTESLISKIRADINAGIQYLRSATFIERIGNLLETATIIDLRAHTTDPERLVLVMQVSGPKPMNEATIAVVI